MLAILIFQQGQDSSLLCSVAKKQTRNSLDVLIFICK